MIEFENEWDFIWYTRKLDADNKYAYKHNGKPEKYPCCLLESEFWDNPNGPYEYFHSFLYQQEVVCEQCGHRKLVWPQVEE